MPIWGSQLNNAENYEKNAKILLKYAKRLRGFTVDEGKVFEETENSCINGVCGL
jgi:hypothetical protein